MNPMLSPEWSLASVRARQAARIRALKAAPKTAKKILVSGTGSVTP